jgi:hypothetical protein
MAQLAALAVFARLGPETGNKIELARPVLLALRVKSFWIVARKISALLATIFQTIGYASGRRG